MKQKHIAVQVKQAQPLAIDVRKNPQPKLELKLKAVEFSGKSTNQDDDFSLLPDLVEHWLNHG